MSDALKFLQKKEWSMGNGQCPECCGSPPDWHGHPCHPTAATIGHEKTCGIALAIKELVGAALFLGDYKDSRVFEGYWTEQGFYSMRVKQAVNQDKRSST